MHSQIHTNRLINHIRSQVLSYHVLISESSFSREVASLLLKIIDKSII